MAHSLLADSVDAGVVFADISGYSRLKEHQLGAFHKDVLPTLYKRLLEDTGTSKDLKYQNTWGDAIVLMSTDYIALARFAVGLRNYFRDKSYVGDTEYALTDQELLPRIAFHTGMFYPCFDPYQNRESYFGKHVILASRIEPATPPGCIWVTEEARGRIREQLDRLGQFNAFDMHALGDRELAKGYPSAPMFELTQFEEGPRTPIRNINDAYALGGPGPEDEAWKESENQSADHFFATANSEENGQGCRQGLGVSCEIPRNSLALIAELLRNTEAITETHKFLYQCREILSVAEDLLQHIEQGEDIVKVQQKSDTLRRSMGHLRTFFSNLKRNYGDQDLAAEPWIRMERFVRHRDVATGQLSELDIGKLIGMILAKLEAVQPAEGPRRREILMGDSVLRDSLYALVTGLREIQSIVRPIIETRCNHTVDVVTRCLDRDDELGRALATSRELLPHNSPKVVPTIWPRPGA